MRRLVVAVIGFAVLWAASAHAQASCCACLAAPGDTSALACAFIPDGGDPTPFFTECAALGGGPPTCVALAPSATNCGSVFVESGIICPIGTGAPALGHGWLAALIVLLAGIATLQLTRVASPRRNGRR